MILHVIIIYVIKQKATKIKGKKKCEYEKTILKQFEIQNNHPIIMLQVFHQYLNCRYKL
jgi:hypothetical protein